MVYLPLPPQTFCTRKTDLNFYNLLWVLPFLGQNIFAFLSSVDPKFPCDPVKLVFPYLALFALDLYPLYYVGGLPLQKQSISYH